MKHYKAQKRYTAINELLQQGLTPKQVTERLSCSITTVNRARKIAQQRDQVADEVLQFRSQRGLRVGLQLPGDDD